MIQKSEHLRLDDGAQGGGLRSLTQADDPRRLDPPSSVSSRAALVLAVAPGERRLLPEFGCRVHELPSIESGEECQLAAALVEEALECWTPDLGVERTEVETTDREGCLKIRLRVAGLWHVLTIPHRVRGGEEE
jgi:phage baseplate assembly protein W